MNGSTSDARKRLAESQAEAQTVDEALAKLLYEDCYTTSWRDAPDLYRDIWLNKAAKVIASDWLAQREATLRSSIAAEIEAMVEIDKPWNADEDYWQQHLDGYRVAQFAAATVARGGTK